MNLARPVAVALTLAVVAGLTGCAGAVPAVTSPSASSSPTPSATPTHAAAPTLRVPTTCDDLVPPAALQSSLRLAVHSVDLTPSRTPAGYADKRAGVLTCRWESAERFGSTATVSVWITVVPDATAEAVEDDRAGSFGGGTAQRIDGVAESFQACEPGFFQFCGFEALSGHYGISGGIWDYGTPTFASQSGALRELIARTIPTVGALAAATPLWQPSGATLRGATDCDGMLTIPQIVAATGWPGAHASKSDGGENALSTLEVNAQVGSYWCAITADDNSDSLFISVLPGGASFATSTRPADATAVSDVGDSGYRTADTLDVVAAGGWIQVANSGKLDDGQVAALAKQLLVNVGYTG